MDTNHEHHDLMSHSINRTSHRVTSNAEVVRRRRFPLLCVVYRIFILYLSFATFSLDFLTIFSFSFFSSLPNRYTQWLLAGTYCYRMKKEKEKGKSLPNSTCGARLGVLYVCVRDECSVIVFYGHQIAAHIYRAVYGKTISDSCEMCARWWR